MKKSYLIVGFTDKNKMADYEKSYIRKGNALKRIEKWLKENGIEILYKGKVRRAYKWDEMRTHRIVYMGKGTLRNS